MKKQLNFYYGGDYNPEQWDESVWREDMRLMKKAGVNYVSVNIFSWALLQPDEDIYDFSTLDKIMDMLADNHIAADLATATAAPPAWLARKYPQSLPVDINGVHLLPGSRQHYCPNSRDYRRLARALVDQIARRYRDHPALAMWHVNNEFGCHVFECYCGTCRAAFRTWLREKYRSIAALNRSWSTDFWSQRYYDWEEINLPGKMPTHHNPNQQLDYRRFMNDSILSLFKAERDVIRQYTPQIPVMTNLMGLHKPVNGFKWAKEMDLVTWDAYPDPYEETPYLHFMAHDLTRSLKKQPFLLMEQAPGAVNWRGQNAVKTPGQMRLWSYEAVAHGADGIMFFQWRASQGGAEKFHSGMVPHSNDQNSRVFREIVELGQELKKCRELVGTKFRAEAAIVFDWENWWALELDSKPSNLVKYPDQLIDYYRVLHQLNIAVDFISPDEDLKHYKIVFAPASYQVSRTFGDRVRDFVQSGGTFVTNFFSGIVDKEDRIYLGGYPGAYKDALGIYVEEFAPMKKGQSHRIATPWGDAAIRIWEEVIHLKEAQVLARFKEGYLAGMPAVTEHVYGNGRAFYVGTDPEEAYLKKLIRGIVADVRLAPPMAVPEGVEVTVRESKTAGYYFILNHTDQEKRFVLEGEYEDLLTGTREKQLITLAARDVKVLKETFNP
ncbi:beta-galactosidase [Sporolactobacillus sp. CQH2019]|uniref:beta-galactosidase n=1 Tax=Sporolactobacillus sp. CQH2019 TaxID=3023512 RepID=UPI0023683FD7|nr:beta-galactosidase [Sporolactobacillus sp. CQH2019]MDD9147954.1 beta-galactosidase [Sporolactobacillus sp. CQH2019]